VFRAFFHAEQREAKEPSAESSIDADMTLRQAVGRLDKIDREIVMLREFEQLSYAEIAELTGMPLNTVRSRLFRARQSLHDLLTAPVPAAPTTKFAGEEERA
jgi:RNA polymerase sigma factor (sigma-70 family)